MFEAIRSPYLVPFDGSFRVSHAPTRPGEDAPDKKESKKRRFLSRIDEPEKNWKFSTGDVKERRYWEHYMEAYQDALNATSRSWAPWYAIPADDKPFMRAAVAGIVVQNLEALGLRYPELGEAERARLGQMRLLLENE